MAALLAGLKKEPDMQGLHIPFMVDLLPA